MEPKIIFEDQDFLVIDKPAGMIVNTSDTTKGERTVQEWAGEYLKVPQVARVSQVDIKTRDTFDTRDTFLARGGIVHRLDKETSGVLIIAKTEEAFIKLQSQFKERTVKKTYLALSHGAIVPTEGEINVPVGRLPWNRMQFGVVAGGREALTRYKVLSIKYLVLGNGKTPLSLVELYPETGRTHQIRVHLKHIGHPIVSDTLYAGRKTARGDRKVLDRIFLHAFKITFNHPIGGEQLSFESPLPEKLQAYLETLES